MIHENAQRRRNRRVYATAAMVLALAAAAFFTWRSTSFTSDAADENRPGLVGNPALVPRPIRDESDAFFASDRIWQIKLQLQDDNANKLRVEARGYVECELIQDDGEPYRVGLKLKGAAGSFRELDDRPAFTVSVDKYRKQQSLNGLTKFYLNNSVQDDSYYSEWLCAHICRQLRLPAPRITFAHVWLSDRDLGLYVLKEGFDKRFLARHFREPSGGFYDGGFLQDIDVDLEKDSGQPKDDLSDLHALRAACMQADLPAQRSALEQTLDVDAFLTFMAFETMACHWDGYVPNMNNYRLYFPPNRGAWFLPHGMDQMFQQTEMSIFEPRDTIVTRSVRAQSDWNEQYRARVRELLPAFEPASLIAELERLEQRLAPELLKLDPECGPTRQAILDDWRGRLTRRYANILEQLEQPDPERQVGDAPSEEPVLMEVNQSITLDDWYPRQETPAAVLTSREEGEPIYRIETGEADECIASWRRSLRLPLGRYRLSVEMRGENVQPRTDDDRGIGAGVRISGSHRDRGFTKDFDWQPTYFDFAIDEPTADIELVSELRAISGWCEMRQPTLMRLSDQ